MLMFWALAAHAEEPDHDIHQQLRAVLQEAQGAISRGDYPAVLPLLTEDVEATSLTQQPLTGRPAVAAYFEEWFGPGGYMKSMDLKLEADTLTELSPDKSWGLVRGSGLEHYVAKDGDEFDFVSRWTAVMVHQDDGQWRIRAVHFGTNHLDNPVLTKVSHTLIRDGVIASVLALGAGVAAGWFARGRLGSR